MFFASTAMMLLANCSGEKQDQATESHEGHDDSQDATQPSPAAEASDPQFQVNRKFQEQLSGVFISYVELKDAFLESHAKKVRTEASETKAALAKVDMKLVSGAAHNDWMSFLTPMQNSLNGIESNDDIESQRELFSTLSDNLYKSVKAFGIGGTDAFYEYCPMAFNNEGGYWLSDNEKIVNPYFGDKMLNCGEVKEKL